MTGRYHVLPAADRDLDDRIRFEVGNIVHGRGGKTGKRNAGLLRPDLTSRRVAPPC
jgi:hypothetical protein